MRAFLIAFVLLLFGFDLSAQVIDTELVCAWHQRAAGLKEMRGLAYETQRLGGNNIELIRFQTARDAAQAFERLHRSQSVEAVQYNWTVSFRTTPDDPEYGNQSNLERAGFETAWDLTTGGMTSDGQEIVVAVLDAGFDAQHNDLIGSLWQNPDEVPGDGIDNDANGLIDDIHGWDYASDSPRYQENSHGTQVIGLLGARGNNGLGISGTNWQTRMMLFGINTVADIVASYAYVLAERTVYNETGGRRGSFVVATNASFGIEGGTCESFPVWAKLYEDMGRAGILTAASTANRHWDVDMFGDMPTDCPTEYLLGVANVDTDDKLYRSSGFGKQSIDLAAPGEGSYSIRPGDRYGSFGSTSAAAPYITGAIALLYATPCPALLSKARQDPASAALLIRQTILSTVKPHASLEFRSVTGGIIDVAAAQLALLDQCEVDGSVDLEVSRFVPNPADGRVVIETTALALSESTQLTIQDALGRPVRVSGYERLSGTPMRLAFDVSDLPAGWYSILITDRDRSAREILIVR